MAVTGLLVGWRIHTSVGEALGGFLLLLVFAYAISWLMALVGLTVRTPEVVNNASFIVIFPITFVANTFVPLETFPPVLRTFAEWNPVSTVDPGGPRAVRQHPGRAARAGRLVAAAPGGLLAALGGAILAVFVPLSVRKYLRTASR